MRHQQRSSAHRTLTSLGILVLLVGCGAPALTPTLPASRGTGLQAADPPVLVLRAYTGGFEARAQRTAQIPAETVVFDDGVVVADVGVSPAVRYAAIQLTADELQSVRDVLEQVDPGGFFVPYDPSFHVVSEMTIIQVHPGGEQAIEVAVAGLYAAQVSPPPDVAPPWATALDSKMTELRDLVDRRGGVDFAGEIPTVDGVDVIPGQARWGAVSTW